MINSPFLYYAHFQSDTIFRFAHLSANDIQDQWMCSDGNGETKHVWCQCHRFTSLAHSLARSFTHSRSLISVASFRLPYRNRIRHQMYFTNTSDNFNELFLQVPFHSIGMCRTHWIYFRLCDTVATAHTHTHTHFGLFKWFLTRNRTKGKRH